MTTDLRDALRLVAEAAPAGAFVPVQRELLLDLVTAGHGPALVAPTPGATWRERLWTCPDDARLRVPDVAEALGRPRSFVYRAVEAKRGAHRLPASRLSGELVFRAGAVRGWIAREEQGA